MSRGSSPGRPKSQPCPKRAPRACATASCSSVSMPSASSTAPERSDCALTAWTMAAIAGEGLSCTSRRSSLMTSGAMNGISASERWSAPTSSSAIRSPRPRIVSTRASISAGLSVSARSVSSTTTSSSVAACSNRAMSAGGMSTSSSDGSTLTNRVLRRRASKAPCSAAARQAHSSSASSPHARAASNSRSGRSNEEPTGPRARASYATTSRVSRSTIGWYRERMRPPSRISRSSAASVASLTGSRSSSCLIGKNPPNMRTDWPNDAQAAISLTFDVDAETGWLGEDPAYANRL